MSELTTIARPYAKAAFAHALAENAIGLWASILEGFTFVYEDERAQSFLDNPAASIEQRAALFDLVTDQFSNNDEAVKAHNFIALLAENRRMDALPEIHRLFTLLRAEYEKTLAVTVRTFRALADEQKSQLTQMLERRLQRTVVIHEELDQSLLGGAIIQAGDFVIDGSVKGKLNKLAASIAA